MRKTRAKQSEAGFWSPADSNAYYKVPELELNSARFDLDLNGLARGTRRYVICSTQRSGSWLLCRQLINAGIGVPHEYFNRLHIDQLCGRWSIDRADAQAYLRALLARRTTPNGVWGTKLQWDQYINTRPHLDELILRQARYIYLYRGDRCAQAVSLHLSMVTGIWGFDATETTKYDDVTMGDMEHVAYCLRKIDGENDAWRSFFVERGIEPLAICYEDLVADQASFLSGVAQYLGLVPADYRVPRPECREDAQTPELRDSRQRLLEHCRRALGGR
jgi:LPS sulfotransferase NodH